MTGLRQFAGRGRAADLKRRLASITLALTDQVLFAGSNFLLSLLTARWMAPEEFGALATALVVQTLVISVYEAGFTEPLTVFGAGRFSDRFRAYLGTLLIGHAIVAALIAGLLISFVLPFHLMESSLFTGALLGLGLSLPFVLVRYLTRRACYVTGRPRSATISGVVYASLLFAGMGYLAYTDHVSSAGVFLFLALASAAAALVNLVELRPSRPGPELLKMVPADHWAYSRWSMATALLKQLPSNIWYFALPIWAGLEGNAAFRAISNLNLFMGHLLMAVGVLLLPAMVRAYHSDLRKFQSLSLQFALGLGTVAFCYWITVWVFGAELIGIMYGGKYVEHAGLLAILGATPLATVFGVISTMRAQAAEQPSIVFRGTMASMVAILPGLWLTYTYGLVGVVWATFLVTLVGASFLLRSTIGLVPAGGPKSQPQPR